MASPPLSAGGANFTIADAIPGVATSAVGAAGGTAGVRAKDELATPNPLADTARIRIGYVFPVMRPVRFSVAALAAGERVAQVLPLSSEYM